MRIGSALFLVFAGGFAVMVLEIIGARYLAKDFGSSFYVWVSQIGVILTALALGYYFGGVLADRYHRPALMTWLLVPTGVLTALIPNFAPPVVDAIITRHPIDRDIPVLWQKVDPAVGSALIFFLPCCVLAAICPYTVRLVSRSISHVGRVSGGIYAASTAGSIAGVFVSGYVLVDQMSLSTIFRATGALTAGLGIFSAVMERWFRAPGKSYDS